MPADSAIRRSLEEYIRRRVSEIPDEIANVHSKTRQVWKCENEADFLYGYFVGRIEEGAMRYLLKATKSSLGIYSDPFEIRSLIEAHKSQLSDAVRKSLGTI
jgi:hypothetical protein